MLLLPILMNDELNLSNVFFEIEKNDFTSMVSTDYLDGMPHPDTIHRVTFVSIGELEHIGVSNNCALVIPNPRHLFRLLTFEESQFYEDFKFESGKYSYKSKNAGRFNDCFFIDVIDKDVNNRICVYIRPQQFILDKFKEVFLLTFNFEDETFFKTFFQ